MVNFILKKLYTDEIRIKNRYNLNHVLIVLLTTSNLIRSGINRDITDQLEISIFCVKGWNLGEILKRFATLR